MSKYSKKLSLINIIFIIISFVCANLRLADANILIVNKISAALCIIALIFGVFYATNDYKKDGNKFYKIYMTGSLICSLLNEVSLIMLPNINFDIVMAIVFGAIVCFLNFALAFKKDLGKDKSISLASMAIGSNIMIIIIFVFFMKSSRNIALGPIQLLLVSIVSLMFVIYKYIDKYSRGSK